MQSSSFVQPSCSDVCPRPAQQAPVLLRYALIRTTRRLTLDILEQADCVTYDGEDDGPYFKFVASNGYEVISRSRMDIQTERLWLLGAKRQDESRSGSMVFSSNEKRDAAFEAFTLALREWASANGGVAVEAGDQGTVSVAQAWAWAGGNIDITPSLQDLRFQLQTLDEICEGADRLAQASPEQLSQAEVIAIKRSARAASPTQQWGDTLAFGEALLARRDEQWRSLIRREGQG